MIKNASFEHYEQALWQASDDYGFDFKVCGTILLISATAHMSLAGLTVMLAYQGYQSYATRFGFINESSRLVGNFLARVQTSGDPFALLIKCQQGFHGMDRTVINKTYNQQHLQWLVRKVDEERVLASELDSNSDVHGALDQIHTFLTSFLVSQNIEDGWVETGAEKELIEAENQKIEK